MSMSALSMVLGLIALVAGGELLVRGASSLAATMRISPLVIGLTVVAFGTSSPELAVSVQSAIAENTDIAVGNVVGSNIFNVLFILGLSALIVPLAVASQLIRREVPLMIAVSVLALLLGLDGRIGRADGIGLFVVIIIYSVWCIRHSRGERKVVEEEFAKELPKPVADLAPLFFQGSLIVVGLVLLVFGANWLVTGSVAIATRLGVSELVIGLTIVAAGTSLPELVTSILAAMRGERDIAVGNVVGSNLFNILCVLGLAGAVSPVGVEVSKTALRFDIPVMIAVAIACLPIFFTGNQISRWEGGLFLGFFVAYSTYLVLDASEHIASRTLAGAMIWFVIPLTVLTLSIAVYRTIRTC